MTDQIEQIQRNSRWLQRCGTAFRLALASAFLAGTILVTAPAGDADAAAGDRALTLYNVHTQETATIVFKRNGRYDSSGLQKLNVFLRDWRKNEPTKMDPHLFDLIWQVYQQSGSRVPIHVVCGYRSSGTNEMLRTRTRYTGVAKHSQHMLGKAMDFYIPDVPLPKLRAIGLRMEIGGVGFYPTSGSPFVHMDTGSVRHWPKMTREQLVRIFPDGKTIHIPSDGRPLPGYEQALAAYKARKASGGEIMMASASTGSSKKSWFSRLTGGGADEADDESDALPNVKAADAAAIAADEDAPAPARKPAAPVQVAAAAATDDAAAAGSDTADQAVPFETATAPLPRPAPNRPAEQPVVVADASADMADDAALPPMPRPSPVARPMVAMASASGTAPAFGKGASNTLAVIDGTSRAKTAADAIADAVGGSSGSAAPVMAYAPAELDQPHIDATTGALVAGHAARSQMTALPLQTASGAEDWQDPLARLTPVGYSAETIELVTRTGSTRQRGYAELAMPHPFAMPELFVAPARSIKIGFGRIAYEGLRTDRFAGPLVRPLGTMEFASVAPYQQTAFLKR
ncbi:DUF882 domain-containing protein [Kaistia dalseonensis]|uniref:Murein endopeptidase K n=1 Tax=Kaistia dalseonensis TaxID=410840 RepID=A0ABU0HBG6_9HYPH|nr:DUF882 domain-containing protein [Kaistia dalseonensis]MCX5496590.1 DUF882 domain-containing protein [Kaistia dalseonensis]MDQ0439213.1 uncharacterized protein YcbK (DUF882 family) [Kaistia dalseonensis]